MDEPTTFFGKLKNAVTSRLGPSGFVMILAAFAGGGALVGGLFYVFGNTSGPSGPVESQFFQIGTGAVTGTYYPLGSTISSVIANPAGSVRCADATRCGPPGLSPSVLATDGSVSNVGAVHRLRIQSAFAQANVLNQAMLGEAPFETPHDDLRAISGLYQELIHLVVVRGSGIESVADLRGQRVSIDREGSGTFGIATQILDAHDLSGRNVEIVNVPADQSAEMLLTGELDAFFFVAGAPVQAVSGLADLHRIELVPLTGSNIDALVDAQPYLVRSTIPGGTYVDVDEPTPTIGVSAVWFTHESAEYDLIYRITRALWNGQNKQILNTGPAQAQLMTAPDALTGVPISFHPGALAYYREAGVLDDTPVPLAD